MAGSKNPRAATLTSDRKNSGLYGRKPKVSGTHIRSGVKYPYEFNPEIRKKAKVYSRVKIILGIVNGLVLPIGFLLAFFFSELSLSLRDFLGPGLLSIPAFILILFALINLAEFPLRYYAGFLMEHKYKISRQSKKAWFKDYFKGLLLGFLFAVPAFLILYSLIWMEFWWIWASVLYFLMELFLNLIYPELILPFFYKLSPLKDKALEGRLLQMVGKAGAKDIGKILVAKESEKSVRANALFAGIGKTKKMVLFDTLLDNFTKDEVETVIGHELAHYVNKDVWRDILLNTVLIIPVFFLIGTVLSSGSLGLESPNDIAGLPIFLAVIELFGLVLLPLKTFHSRAREKSADWKGLEWSRQPEAQISTEKRLADLALSDDNPNRLVEIFLYTHPPARKRIEMVEEWKKQDRKKVRGSRKIIRSKI